MRFTARSTLGFILISVSGICTALFSSRGTQAWADNTPSSQFIGFASLPSESVESTFTMEVPVRSGNRLAACSEVRVLRERNITVEYVKRGKTQAARLRDGDVRTFHCTLDGSAEQFLRLTLAGDSLVRGSLFADSTYELMPAENSSSGTARTFAVAEIDRSVIADQSLGCLLKQLPGSSTTNSASSDVTSAGRLDIFVDLDPAWMRAHDRHNTPLNRNALSAHPSVQAAIAALNSASGMLKQAGIEIDIAGIRVWDRASRDPYSGRDGRKVLSRYASAGHERPNAGTRLLMTAKELSAPGIGRLLGAAYQAGACEGRVNAAVVRNSEFNNGALVAHELAHSLGAGHESAEVCNSAHERRSNLLCGAVFPTAGTVSDRSRNEISGNPQSDCVTSPDGATALRITGTTPAPGTEDAAVLEAPVMVEARLEDQKIIATWTAPASSGTLKYQVFIQRPGTTDFRTAATVKATSGSFSVARGSGTAAPTDLSDNIFRIRIRAIEYQPATGKSRFSEFSETTEVSADDPALTPVPEETAPPGTELTPSPDATRTPRATATPRDSRTPAPTRTPVPTRTPRDTVTPKPTRTASPTRTPRSTATTQATRTPVPTRTPRATFTAKATLTPVPTRTPLNTPTVRPSWTPSNTPTATVTRTPVRTRTPIPSYTPSATKTVTPTRTPLGTRTPRLTVTPGKTRIPTPTQTPRPTFTPRPTWTPRPTKSATPTRTPRPTTTPRGTRTPEGTATAAPFPPTEFEGGLTARQQTDGSVRLVWKDVEYEDVYQIERNGRVIRELDADSGSYTDSEADPNVNYEYTVRALNSLGESATSAGITTAQQTLPPSEVKALYIDDGCAVVTWLYPNDAVNSIVGFDVNGSGAGPARAELRVNATRRSATVCPIGSSARFTRIEILAVGLDGVRSVPAVAEFEN